MCRAPLKKKERKKKNKKAGTTRVQFLPFANYRAARDNNGIVRLRRRRLISRLSRGSSEPDTSNVNRRTFIALHRVPRAILHHSAGMNDCAVSVINVVQYADDRNAVKRFSIAADRQLFSILNAPVFRFGIFHLLK